MSVTDNLNITEVATNQTQKEVTINADFAAVGDVAATLRQKKLSRS